MLNESVRTKAAQALAGLPNPVKLVVFTQEMECALCRENRALAEEVAGLSDRLSVEVHNLLIDKQQAEHYQVDKVPAICLEGEGDSGIRFYGVPAGFEFSALLAAIEATGRRESGLKPETVEQLARLENPVDITVFSTLTCPYCPMMTALAHRFALASTRITASGIDAAEFPHLANLYQVMAVPKTVINRQDSFEGVVPEEKLLEAVLKTGAGKPQ